jgi:GNAT superfamily N-acetyltransferase/predicted nucleic acid-binding protein
MTESVTWAPPPPRFRLLLDTNVFIAVEPFDGTAETGLVRGAVLVRLAAEQGHSLLVHPATRDDLGEGRDLRRRQQRLAELAKYPMLEESRITGSLVERAGSSVEGSNDHRDLRLLAALDGRAATYLVTGDTRLLRRARRAGLGDATLTIDEAIALLEGLQPARLTPPPRVTEIAAYTIDIEQKILDGLRQDYGEEFDRWLDKVRSDSANRTCLVVKDDDTYAALAIIKIEFDCEYRLAQPVLKISTFKVAENYAGAKYGELLLKSIFMLAAHRGVASVYVEVFAKHEPLIDFFDTFGFEESSHQTSRNELVLVKTRVRPQEPSTYSALDFHVLFGPPAIKTTERSFIVPIIPKWHDQLFPDSPQRLAQRSMMLPGLDIPSENHPFGNALRKAYLCNSNIAVLEPGDVLFFYRSHDLKALTTVGVVESTLRSDDPQEIMTFVGRRTVYRPDEIVTMCRSVRGVLAILFRQDRFIEPPWQLGELQANRVLRAWPQTIVRVTREGSRWLRQQLPE